MTAHRLRLPPPTSAQRRGRSFFITTYCVLFVLPAIACYLIIDSVGLNIGDFLGSAVEATENQALAGLAIFLAVYAGFHRFGRKMLDLPTATSSPVPRNSLIYVIFAGCFAIDLFFYLILGFGRAGAETSTPLSIFSTMLPKDIALLLALHINSHQPRRMLFIMAGYSAFALSLGWTGQFFTLFIASLYMFRDTLRRRKLLVMAILVAGIAIYPAIFSIKLGVRQGDAFEYDLLAVMHLASRLTGYPAMIYMQGEHLNFLARYADYFDNLIYVVEPLLAIIPKAIFGLQGNITLEKAIVDYVGGVSELTQFIWGLPTKLWFYWQVSPLHFVLFVMQNALLFWAAYAWARRRRNEFLTFYLLFLLGLYIWAGDISTLFVSLLRIAVFFILYNALDAAFPRRRRHRDTMPAKMIAPAVTVR